MQSEKSEKSENTFFYSSNNLQEPFCWRQGHLFTFSEGKGKAVDTCVSHVIRALALLCIKVSY